MKSLFLLLFILLTFTSVNSQTQDLENLAEGKMTYADILYDSDNNLYGYIYFFDQEKRIQRTISLSLFCWTEISINLQMVPIRKNIMMELVPNFMIAPTWESISFFQNICNEKENYC